MDEVKVGKEMLFLSSWPHGRLRHVSILKRRTDIRSPKPHWYIEYLDTGGTDTTNNDFLFDIPKELRD